MQPRTIKSAVFALFSLFLASSEAFAAATILPQGQTCFQAQTGLNGMVGTIGTITPGSGGTAGTYGGVSLTGGSGSGATANITVAGGVVTAVTILNPGIQYVIGDVLSASSATIGNTSGFSVPVATTSINSSLAGGSVTFYYPNTSIFKSTWFNADQTSVHQNTDQVGLDQNGCAIIYGIGLYREVLKDSLGNTIWDAVTADTSANNSTFWAGISAGTPNVITVVDPGFNATDGSIINFTAVSSNTGPATLNPSGFGAISILKDTTGGPVSLTGGEIVQNNPISLIFRSMDNAFHLLNTAIPSASGATAPLCGAIGLSIANSGVTPNSVVTLSADQVVMQTANGLTMNRSSVSLPAINTTTGNVTAAANGMDGEAPGTNNWLYVYAIDNGAAPAGLLSLSATAPTMPSGYTFRCRLGAVRVDGSGNLYRLKQLGRRAQYVTTPATNTVNFIGLSLGAVGSNCNTATPTLVMTSAAVAVPPTAFAADLVLMNQYNAQPNALVAVSSNINVAGVSSTNPPLFVIDQGTPVSQFVSVPMETAQQFALCSGAGGGAVYVAGWVDRGNLN